MEKGKKPDKLTFEAARKEYLETITLIINSSDEMITQECAEDPKELMDTLKKIDSAHAEARRLVSQYLNAENLITFESIFEQLYDAARNRNRKTLAEQAALSITALHVWLRLNRSPDQLPNEFNTAAACLWLLTSRVHQEYLRSFLGNSKN